MNFSEKLENLEYELDAAFESEGFDVTEEDLAGYEEEMATEATVKGTTKKVVAFVVAICRKVVAAITEWVRNRSINKFVALLKNKVAKFTDSKEYEYTDPNTNNKVKKNMYAGSGQASAIYKVFKDIAGGGVGPSQLYNIFANIIKNFKSNDMLARLTTLNRQIKSTQIDKFGKALKDIKTEVKSNKGEVNFADIGSSGTDWVSKFPLLSKVVESNVGSFDASLSLTKGQCDTIGKCLKMYMSCLSNFTLKTMHFFDRQEDTWFKTANQKAVVAALKNVQKAVRNVISMTNSALQNVKTGNLDEKDDEGDESVDLSTMMMDMAITNESMDDLIAEMNEIGTEDLDLDLDLDLEI